MGYDAFMTNIPETHILAATGSKLEKGEGQQPAAWAPNATRSKPRNAEMSLLGKC